MPGRRHSYRHTVPQGRGNLGNGKAGVAKKLSGKLESGLVDGLLQALSLVLQAPPPVVEVKVRTASPAVAESSIS
jgi:hypothetical protein